MLQNFVPPFFTSNVDRLSKMDAGLQDQMFVGLGPIPKTSWAVKTIPIKSQESEKASGSQPNENARGVHSKPKCFYKSAVVK